MNSREIQLSGLIALRALAEFDPVEFRRVTDLSRRDLDAKIRTLHDDYGESESWHYYGLIQGLLETSKNEQANHFPMRQIYMACNTVAQYHALIERRIDNATDIRVNENVEAHTASGQHVTIQSDDLLRLSVMRLLRTLRDYRPLFHYKVGRNYVDCVLEPSESQLPFIIIETKRLSEDWERNRGFLKALQQSMKVYGEDTVGIIVTGVRKREHDEEIPNGMFILEYDLNNNQFSEHSFSKVLTWFNSINRI